MMHGEQVLIRVIIAIGIWREETRLETVGTRETQLDCRFTRGPPDLWPFQATSRVQQTAPGLTRSCLTIAASILDP